MDLGRSQTIGSVGEFYWSGAASTSFWIDPSEDLIGIQMAQFQPSGHHLVSDDFKVMAYQAIAD
jgi:CubicO group peptidase (beta-lactamase class C family)